MSGFEVAGIVLGSIPIVVSALQCYMNGLGTLQNFRSYKRILKRLILTLKTEHVNLQNICEKLLTGIAPQTRIEEMIRDPFGDLWREEIFNNLRLRLWSSLQVFDDRVQDMREAIEEMMEKLNVGTDGKAEWAESSSIKKQFKRATFIFQKSNHEEALTRIRDGVSALQRHDDHHLERWTSGIDDAQWHLNFGWGIDHCTLLSIENHEFDSLFDYNRYHGPYDEALGADLDSLSTQHQETSKNQLTLVTETHATLITMKEVSPKPQKHLDSLNVPHSVPWHRPDLSPPLCNTSPSSNAPTSHSPSSRGHDMRPSQPSTSSPVFKDARLACDFCGQGFGDVDSLYSHLISSHIASIPLHCGRKRCNKTFKDNRSLKRHLTEFHLGSVYVCRCGRQDGRKDKHCKHIESHNCTGTSLYSCLCGHSFDQLKLHRHHIDRCGKKRRGRPRKYPTTAYEGQ